MKIIRLRGGNPSVISTKFTTAISFTEEKLE